MIQHPISLRRVAPGIQDLALPQGRFDLIKNETLLFFFKNIFLNILTIGDKRFSRLGRTALFTQDRQFLLNLRHRLPDLVEMPQLLQVLDLSRQGIRLRNIIALILFCFDLGDHILYFPVEVFG